jgi:hypothetical protein
MAAKKNSKKAASTAKQKPVRKPEATTPETLPTTTENTRASRNEPTADQPALPPTRGRKKAAPLADQSAGAKPGGRLSALDAAARLLQESGTPMNCAEMITAMAQKGYWTSPGGKTPSATLYSAILRELQTKGPVSRFVKTERGKFARTDAI